MSSMISDTEKELLNSVASDFGNGVQNLGRDPSMFGMDSFTLSATFEMNSLSGGSQTLLWNHTQYGIGIADNDLVVALRTESGKLDYIKVPDVFDEAGWHDVQVVLDDESGSLEFHVDGQVVYSGPADDYELSPTSYWDVTAGGKPWGKALDGQVADISIHDEALPIDNSQSVYQRMYELDKDDTSAEIEQLEQNDNDKPQPGPQLSEEELLNKVSDSFGDGIVKLGRDPSMYNMDEFTLSVTFDLNSLTGGAQTLLWNHTQYGILIKDNDLKIALRGDDGKLDYIKIPDALEDTGWHDIQVVLDKSTGTLEVFLDGGVVYSGSGEEYSLQSYKTWDVTAGGKPWGKELDGNIADVSIHNEALDIDGSQSVYERMYELDKGDNVTTISEPQQTGGNPGPGENTDAVISGSDTGTIKEDQSHIVAGKLNVEDPDAGENGFQAENLAGKLGELTIDAEGNWSYAIPAGKETALQALGEGEVVTEVFVVLSIDGTEHEISVTVEGTNDAAVITGKQNGVVTEDTTLNVIGSLDIQDADKGESVFKEGSSVGQYGVFTVDAGGNWAYVANNGAETQALGKGDTVQEVFKVTSADGTTADVTVTLSGTDDEPVVTGTHTGTVEEDGILETGGALYVEDADQGESGFQPAVESGTYGNFSVDATGNWSYVAEDSDALQALDGSDSYVETFTVKTLDGSEHTVSVTVNGVDEVTEPPVGDGEILVSNAAELEQALENATGGETIVLKSGDYGDFHMDSMNYSAEVTIKSLDASDMATFHSIDLNGMNNLTFDSIFVDNSFVDGETVRWSNSVDIRGSSNIKIVNSRLEGDLATSGSPADTEPGEQLSNGNIIGYPAGTAIGLYDSSGVTLENNDISVFSKGISLAGIDGLVIRDNEIHDLRSTPVRGGDVRNVLIEDNNFHSSQPWALGGQGDHGDYVHLWIRDNQEEPSNNIVVKENYFAQGDGESLLGIYLDNNGLVNGVQFEDVEITDNVIFNGDMQGIRLEGVKGVDISNNTLLQSSGDHQDGPGIVLSYGVEDAVIKDNILSSPVSEGNGSELNKNISISGNFEVQRHDPQGENYVGDLFVNALDQTAMLDDLMALPGSVLAKLGVGAAATQFDETPENIDGFMVLDSGSGVDMMVRGIEALKLYDEKGPLNLDNASIDWVFGDGTEASGLTPSHRYEQAGEYTVTARITLADGREVSVSKMILVETPDALSAKFENNFVDSTDNQNSYEVIGSAEIVDVDGRDAIRVNDGVVAYESTEELVNNSEYTIEFDFKKDTSASVGKAIYFSSSLIVDIKEDGITVAVTTDQGTVWLKPSGIGINDTEWHTFSLTFSGVDGVAKLYMDGQVVASAAELDGAIQVGRSSADFYVGDPFGTGFDGVIDDVEFVRYAKTEEEIQNPGSQSTQSASYETAQDETAQQQENDSEEPTVESAEGADVLTGGAGADTFTFDSVEDSAPDRRDVLENFNASEGDKIFLDGLVEGDISFIGDNEFSLSGTQEQKLDIAAKNFGSGSVNLGRPDDFFNLDDMTLSVTFELNDLTSGKQALLWNHAQYGIMIEDNDLQVALRTDDGSLSYLKFPNALDDAGWHDVQVVMDSVAGTLDIWLDGDVLHSGSNVGYDINAGGSWDVTAGSKLGGSLLNGKIADVSIIDKVIDFNADGLAFDRMVEIDQDDDNTALDLATGDTQVRFDDETKILSVDLDGDLTADMEMELVGVNLQDLDNSNFLI